MAAAWIKVFRMSISWYVNYYFFKLADSSFCHTLSSDVIHESSFWGKMQFNTKTLMLKNMGDLASFIIIIIIVCVYDFELTRLWHLTIQRLMSPMKQVVTAYVTFF